LRNYFYTEDGLKRVAEKSLKKKYGEDFVVYRAWDRSQELFFADCSPKDNPDVVFQADIYKNGAGVYADSYAQAAVAQQVDNIIKGGFEKTYKNCYTKPIVVFYYNEPKFADVKELSLNEYLDESNIGFMGYYVLIANSQATEADIQAEYKFLSDELIQEVNTNIKEGEIEKLSVVLYFVDDEMKEKWKEYHSTNAHTRGTFSGEIVKYPRITCKYESGSINKSYTDYREIRMKGMEDK